MAKMTIVDVDLGQDIADIISDDVEEMTGQLQQVIDEAIEEKRTVETERIKKAAAKTEKSKQILEALDAVYTALLEASGRDEMVGLTSMMSLVHPVITNSSALILQLKSYIRKHKGNEYVLTRRTRDKKPVYLLVPFNAE